MITLKHKDTSVIKELKLGFSWTFFFFGAFVYIFRGNWSEFFKCLFLSSITFGIYPLIQCFTANKKEIVRYLDRGYVTANELSKTKLAQAGIL